MSLEEAQSAPALAFEDVTFGYGQTLALERITFAVRRGDFTALIGPNGSGKTTLIKLALGLERLQHGRILIFGQDVRRFKRWHTVGYVPQHASAFRVRFPATVGEAVSYAEFENFDPSAIFRRKLSAAVERALDLAGLSKDRSQLVSELSIGQQQRVLIARALVRHPELLILDEPTAAIDRAGQERFYTLLRHLREDEGVTVILISHDIGLVLHEANNVACLNCRLHCYRPAQEVTEGDLSHLYGSLVDRVVHRHD